MLDDMPYDETQPIKVRKTKRRKNEEERNEKKRQYRRMVKEEGRYCCPVCLGIFQQNHGVRRFVLVPILNLSIDFFAI